MDRSETSKDSPASMVLPCILLLFISFGLLLSCLEIILSTWTFFFFFLKIFYDIIFQDGNESYYLFKFKRVFKSGFFFIYHVHNIFCFSVLPLTLRGGWIKTCHFWLSAPGIFFFPRFKSTNLPPPGTSWFSVIKCFQVCIIDLFNKSSLIYGVLELKEEQVKNLWPCYAASQSISCSYTQSPSIDWPCVWNLVDSASFPLSLHCGKSYVSVFFPPWLPLIFFPFLPFFFNACLHCLPPPLHVVFLLLHQR